MKYTIHSTKQDYQQMYDRLKLLEDLSNPFNWKKIKKSSLDELKTLESILIRIKNIEKEHGIEVLGGIFMEDN